MLFFTTLRILLPSAYLVQLYMYIMYVTLPVYSTCGSACLASICTSYQTVRKQLVEYAMHYRAQNSCEIM